MKLPTVVTSRFLLIVMLVSGAALTFYSAQNKSFTYDEPAHMSYGMNVIRGKTSRIDDSKMPVTALNMLPARISANLQPGPLKTYLSHRHTTRHVTIIFYILLVLVVMSWSNKLYGIKGALFSGCLLLFDPNIQAHSRLVTTDIYGVFFITLALYAYWSFLKEYRSDPGMISAITLGLAQLSKFTAIYLYPLFLIIFLINFLIRRRINKTKGFVSFQQIKSLFKWLLLFTLISLLIINAGYLFNGTGSPIESYHFKSAPFQYLSKIMSPISHWPLPFPKPFLEGLDLTKFNELTGAYRGPIYFFGELSRSKFMLYFPVLFLLKVPIASLVAIITALVILIKKKNFDDFNDNELFLLCPAFFFMFYFFFICNAQMGIRLALLIFPLLYIFAGSLIQSIKPKWGIFIILGLLISNLSYFPHYLSYFNELVIPRINAYKYFGDSNLDWGQNEILASQFLTKNPEYKKNPQHPVLGKVMISTNLVSGIIDPYRFAWYEWIKANLKPIGHVAYSYHLYDVPPEALLELRQTLPGIKHRIHKQFNPDRDL